MKIKRWFGFRRRLVFFSATLVLAGLCGCVRQTAVALPERVLEFDICPAALATLPERGGFQGYGGWFYSWDDLIKPKANLTEADLVVRVNEALRAQGVKLVVAPLPNLGLLHPEYRYLEDPYQAAFEASRERNTYYAYLDTLRR